MMNCKCFQLFCFYYWPRQQWLPASWMLIVFAEKENISKVSLRAVAEFRVIGRCTHRSLFNDSVEHYNSFGTLLPNHQPEMAAGISQRPLCRQKALTEVSSAGFSRKIIVSLIRNTITDTLLIFYIHTWERMYALSASSTMTKLALM